MKKREKADLPIADTNRIFQSLLDISEILNNINVDWYLGHGAALGAVRDGDLLPYDRDIDIIIPLKEESETNSIDKKFIIESIIESNKFESKYSHGNEHFRIVLKKTSNSTLLLKNCIYFYHKKNDFYIAKVKSLLSEEGIFILPSFLFEKKTYVNIRGYEFPTFTPVENYLEWLYGENWRIPNRRKGFRNFSAKNLRCMSNAKKTLEGLGIEKRE